MRVFVTGATGFIGSHTVPELLKAGHTVLGMSRSDEGAKALAAAGAQVHRGDIYDLDSIRKGAEQAEAVIHLAFNHDFSKFAENAETDRKVITTMGEVLKGSKRPMLITSGTGVIGVSKPGHVSTEEDRHPGSKAMARAASEEAADALAEQGVRVGVVRLPQVHNTQNKAGLVGPLVTLAKKAGVAVYVGDGSARWAAAHVSDVALLYRLAIEQCEAGARYNAVGEEGVSMKAIVETAAKGLGLPVKSITKDEAATYLGPFAMFATHDMPASSAKTQQRLGWTPKGPKLIEDMQQWDYSQF
ncbi:SDR family oxidoreductase [Hyalangium versicolor]|uniref:SDR family oxidoreductase n=1 Tax=Hyalangium versicolor TaxID=2861190 RepID=UPI001CD00FDD|nr:SDR family oxidoreductase [Hyalangium versicolor]